jgi:hypothetical protein
MEGSTPHFPQGSTVAPGMTQVVEAGTIYVIEDNEGEKLEIEGRDHPLVIEFINAFDHWLLLDKTMPKDAEQVRDAAWAEVIAKWDAMPGHIVKNLPSVRAGGIVLPGGHHHDPA